MDSEALWILKTKRDFVASAQLGRESVKTTAAVRKRANGVTKRLDWCEICKLVKLSRRISILK
jgi:hypothetical protein